MTNANDPRPDFSICEWKRTESDHGITLATKGPTEFADAKVAGPVEYFAHETGLVQCSENPRDRSIAGIGLQTQICGDRSFYNVTVRRAADVLSLACFECTREQAVALARAASR